MCVCSVCMSFIDGLLCDRSPCPHAVFPDTDASFPSLYGLLLCTHSFIILFPRTHARTQVFVRKRPYLDKFLAWVSSRFEVVIFTASQQVRSFDTFISSAALPYAVGD